MEKTYDPHAIEERWYRLWEERGDFEPSGSGGPYCIMIPPPNVTGTLHMGHAFQDTLMDALTRYHRMRGFNTLWQPGTDHAGIATQMVVERQLNTQGVTRLELGREEFVERVWQWKYQSGNTITKQLRRLGASLDWRRERFTMDDGLSRAVREVFVQLYSEGLIYRGKRLVNWDPVLHTALSDLEVISTEESGHFWHMRYPLADGSGQLIVATTRPETMLGDTAVAVHPNDERYRHLIGKEIALPLTGRTIPIIADEYVDPEFGSGCVKITPAHDFNDYAIGQRHKLSLINIFTMDARINDNGPPAYRGLDRYEAREKVIADLQAQGLLEKVEDHKLMVPRGDRSHAVVEPYLTDQWYVKIAPLAEPAIKAVEEGRTRFIPENWSKTYFEWMRNIEDWCISRQLWWGHRIPAWYDAQGNVYVAHSEDEVRTKHGLGSEVRLNQDEDVLDTWFSSALWPFSTLGWPEKTQELATFYPTSVLVTGFDIIFFWVARMMMMGLKFMGDVPFREVYVHGLVRDSEGQKMSKSKGNVLDPLDVIDGIDLETLVEKRKAEVIQPHLREKVERSTRQSLPDGISAMGADALRFTFAALATTGRDIKLTLERIEGYRNFCNKLWNAARYVIMATQDQDTGPGDTQTQPTLAERWIRSRFQSVVGTVNQHFAEYRFDLVAQAIYDFTWRDYCDWYVELSKPIIQSETFSAEQKRETRRTLAQILEALLRLLHPITPFITEEIWQQIAPVAQVKGETIQTQPYPVVNEDQVDPEAEAEIEWVKEFIMGVRHIRAEMDIPPSKPLPVLLRQWTPRDQERYTENGVFIENLARLESVQWLEDETAPESATALVDDLQILIPLAGLIDKQAELSRLEKKLTKLRGDLERSEAKLQNPNFADRAPPAIVDKVRTQVSEMRKTIGQLEEQAAKISAI